MVPKHSLLKYFTLTFTRQKSSKFEGSGPPLNLTNWLVKTYIIHTLCHKKEKRIRSSGPGQVLGS